MRLPRIVTFCALATFAALALLPARPALETVSAEAPPVLPAPLVTSPDAAALDRISPDLLPLIDLDTDGEILVALMVDSDVDLDDVTENWRATTVRIAGMRSAAALVASSDLIKLAGHDDVLAVMPMDEIGFAVPADPTAWADDDADGPTPLVRLDIPEVPNSRIAGPAEVVPAAGATALDGDGADPQLWLSRRAFGVSAAAANGFSGDGVIVGIEDTGIDFGHPDLYGTFARANDPDAWYHGYPLMYDNSSAGNYVTRDGNPSGTNYAAAAGSFTATVAVGETGEATIQIPQTHTEERDGRNVQITETVSRTIQYVNGSQSGTIHYGYHPDSRLTQTEMISETAYTNPAVFLVMDEAEAGRYDTVYVDLGEQDTSLNGNPLVATWDFGGVRPAVLTPEGDPTVVKDVDGDGLWDLSGGLVYFIADGEHHVPVLDWLWDVHGEEDEENAIEPPAAGTLVAFFGDFDGSNHGTGVASQIAGQGISDSRFGSITIPPGTGVTEGDRVVGGNAPGIAPGAKLWGTRSLGLPNQWLAMTRGYDGVPGTGDEAQVINNSWGNTSWPTSFESGYQVIPTAINAEDHAPNTLIVVSAGNGGQGYGTVTTMAGGTAFSVGAATQFGSDEGRAVITSSLQLRTGDPASFSSRGPGLRGRNEVAVMAADSASGALPVNLARNQQGLVDGDAAFRRFGGTSQAGPQSTAVAALVFQAYRQRTGEWPTWAEARRLMQFGADDADQDPAVQGAGLVNAEQSTAIAAGLFGARSDHSEWQVGDYRGERYLAFPYTVTPGETYERTFTLTNDGDVPVVARIAGSILETVETQELEVETRLEGEDDYNYRRPDYLIPPGELNIPAGTDLMQVRLAQEFERYCNTDPTGLFRDCGRRGRNAWYLRAYSWYDWNDNGQVWVDANENGIVNDGELDLPATLGSGTTDPRTSYELAPIAESSLSGNSQDLRLHDPIARGGDGIALALIHRVRNQQVPTDTVRFQVRYLRHEPWDLVSVSDDELAIAPGETATFTATFDSTNAPAGYHQGAIRVITQPGNNAQAGVRVFHAAEGVGAVNVLVDGNLVLEGVDYGAFAGADGGEGVGYLDLAPGPHTVRLELPDGTLVHEAPVELRTGTEYTITAVVGEDGPALDVRVDGNLPPADGMGRVRPMHLSPDAGDVDVWIDGDRVLTGLRFREAGPYLNLPVGTRQLAISAAGDEDLVLSTPVEIDASNQTLVVVGSAAEDTLETSAAVSPPRSRYPEHVSSIPVVANVVPDTDLGSAFTLGALPPAASLFDIGRVFGLYDWRGNGTARQGDWRNFFVDVPEDGPTGENTRFLMHTVWEDEPTDIDLAVFGPGERTQGEDGPVYETGLETFPLDPSIMGPYPLELIDRTPDTAHSVGGTAYSFQTATGAAEEWLAAGPVKPGLHMFAHQSVLYGGERPDGVPFTTTVGTATVSPSPVEIGATDDSGTVTITLTASLDLPGVAAAAYGLSALEVIEGTVGQSNPAGNVNDPDGNVYIPLTVTESSALIDLDLAPMEVVASYDLDLFLQREVDDEWATVASSTSPDATEALQVRFPEPGMYRVVVNGWNVPGGEQGYVLELLHLQGDDLQASGGTDELVPAGTTVELTLEWNADFESGERRGLMFVGPSDAPTAFQIPVTVRRPQPIYLPVAYHNHELPAEEAGEPGEDGP